MSNFIGCKIRLISKAGIRYEGILYTIDPQESTVALSKVKSFGTEDRKVDRVIPPRDEVYEYIIFRGSDIQDLNVCEPIKESTLLSEDSAIVRVETSAINLSRNMSPGVMSSNLQMQQLDGWAANSLHRYDNDKTMDNNVRNGTSMANNSKVKDSLDSQSNTFTSQPIGSNRYSSAANKGLGALTSVKQYSNETAALMSANVGTTNSNKKQQQQVGYDFNSKRSMDMGHYGEGESGKYEYNRNKSKQHQQVGMSDKSQKYDQYEYNNYVHHHNQHDTNGGMGTGSGGYKYQVSNYRASQDAIYGQCRDYYYHHSKHPVGGSVSFPTGGKYRRNNDYHQHRDMHYGTMVEPNKLRGFEAVDGIRDYYSQSYEYRTSRGSGNSGQTKQHQQQTQTVDNASNKRKKKNRTQDTTTRNDETFKEDYDFETANAIIAKELANLTVGVSSVKKDVKVGDNVSDKDNVEDLPDSSEICGSGYYDKTKSFFDNISSEMLSRANGKIIKSMNRKEERKINVETFGVAESSRNLSRNSIKWNRGSSNKNSKSTSRGGSNYGSELRGGNINSQIQKSNRRYGFDRRPAPQMLISGGPCHGDDY